MSIFGRKREDVPEIRVESGEATVETRQDPPELEDPAPPTQQATGSRKVKLPKTPWY